MRVFTKKFLLTFLSVILGLTVVACVESTETTTPNNSVVPVLSNPDDVFISTDDYDITYSDLYEEIKKNDGLNQLLLMVDTDLLSTYIDQVTEQDITDKINDLTYGTHDPEEMADFTAEEMEEAEKAFADSMSLLGYSNNIEDYVKVIIARAKYAESTLNDETNVDETWYSNALLVKNYYNASYYEDAQLIRIRFTTEANAKAMLRSLNLVSKDGELKLYTGVTPLADVPSSALNDTNTRSLTDDELLNYFLQMYNLVYGDYLDPVDENSTYADVLTMDEFTYDYDSIKSVNTNFPTFIYKTLGTYENVVNEVDDTPFYTYEPVRYFSSDEYYYFMILNLDRSEKVDVSDFDGDEAELEALIGTDVYNEIRDIINESSLDSSTFINNRVIDLRAEHGFDIYDYYLGLDYQLVNSDYELNEEGHESIVAVYDDKEITADQLFTTAMNINAALYTIYASQTKAVIASHYADLYCTEGEDCITDVLENDSEAMAAHKADMESAKTEFESGYYASYYTYDQYLYLAYGVKSQAQLLSSYYVKSTLQPFFIYDKIIEDNYAALARLVELMQPYYDNYFSLDVQHILIFVDMDEDGSPDDYDKFRADLEDPDAYNTKLANFELAIRAYLAENDNNMALLQEEYASARRDDATWGQYISYGFYLIYENLGNLNYTDSISTYEESFVDGLVELYQTYDTEPNKNKEYMMASTLVNSSYGAHLIYAEKGTDFEQPNGQFTMIYDTVTGDPLYSNDLVNLGTDITMAQIQYYADYRFSNIVSDNVDLAATYGLGDLSIPASLGDAFDVYLADIYDAYYVVGYMNTIVANQLLVGDYLNEASAYCNLTAAQFEARLQEIIEVYNYQIFASYDHTTDE